MGKRFSFYGTIKTAVRQALVLISVIASIAGRGNREQFKYTTLKANWSIVQTLEKSSFQIGCVCHLSAWGEHALGAGG